MRHAWVLTCALALLFAPACSDDTGPGQPDTLQPDSLQTDTVSSDGLSPDSLAPDGPAPDGPVPDGPVPDGLVPDSLAPDGLGADTGTPDTFSADVGVNTPGKCATAPVIGLTNGTVTIKGDTSTFTDEFSALSCQGLFSTTSALDAPQAYYKIQGKQDQWYRIIFRPSYSGAYAYVFTSTACTEAAIQTDCRSAGVTGASSRTSASSSSPRVIYFKSPSAAPFTIGADGLSASGTFELEVTEIPTPTNATCANATAMTFFNGKAIATVDTHDVMTPDEFSSLNCGLGGKMDGPQAYLSFIAKAGQSYRIKATNNAGYFTYIYVFGASCVEADIQAACSSSGTSGLIAGSFSSGDIEEVAFTPPTAGMVHIAIDGNDAYDYGNVTVEIEEFTPPTNGVCANADPITLSGGKATINGTTLGVVNEYGNSVDCTGFTNYDGPQVYYKLTAVAGKAYKLSLTPSFSARWYVFKAGSCGNATAINANCGSGGVDGANPGFASSSGTDVFAFRPVTPGNYIIAIDSSSPSTLGTFTLAVEEFTAPTNDKACTATPVSLTAGKATINGSSLGALNEFGLTSSDGVDCGNFSVFDGPQVYYEVDIDATKGYKFKLSPQFSSAYLYVFPKGSCAARAPIDAACADGGLTGNFIGSISSGSSDTLNFSPNNSGKYVIAIDTSNAAGGGDFLLEITELNKPKNDTCAAAAALTLSSGEVTVNSTTGFSSDEYSTLKCKSGTSTSSTLDGPQLYWSLTMSAAKNYAITATTTFSSGYLYIFDGAKTCSEANIQADCQSGGASGIAKGTISSGAGTAYFKPPTSGSYKIGIDSYANSGDVTLNVKAFDPATNQSCAAAKTLTLAGNTVSESGFTVGTTDEFAGLIKCGGTPAFAAGQTYYKVSMQANIEYTIGLTADYRAKLYLFAAGSACTAAAIEADCASGGSSGDVKSITSTSGGNAAITFMPSTAGDYYIVVDGETAADVGGYTVKVTAFQIPTLVVPTTGLLLDFEASSGGLAAKGDWEWGKLAWAGGTCGVAPPNNQGHVPTQTGMWGTVLNDCYNNLGNNQGGCSAGSSNKADDSVLTFNLTLPASWTSAKLEYWEHADLFISFDWGEVYVDGKLDTATQICSGGSSAQKWEKKTIDLSAHVGTTINIAYHMMASSVVDDAGWYIDEISVTGN